MEIYSSKTQYHKYLRKICKQYNSVSAKYRSLQVACNVWFKFAGAWGRFSVFLYLHLVYIVLANSFFNEQYTGITFIVSDCKLAANIFGAERIRGNSANRNWNLVSLGVRTIHCYVPPLTPLANLLIACCSSLLFINIMSRNSAG